MPYVFMDFINCDRFACRYNRAVWDSLGGIKIRLTPPIYGFPNFIRDHLFGIPRLIEKIPPRSVIVGTYVDTALAGMYGFKGIVLPHLESPMMINHQLGRDDPLRESRVFRDEMFFRTIALSLLKKSGPHRYAGITYFESDAEYWRRLGVETWVVPGYVPRVKKVEASKKYDVVLQCGYWKSMGNLKVIRKTIQGMVGEGLRVAVHDYGETGSIREIALKNGADYYGRLPKTEYYRLYSSAGMAYMLTLVEAFGMRFYEVGQLTHVATNIRHYDDVFPRVHPYKIADYYASLTDDTVRWQRGEIMSRAERWTYENFLSEVRRAVGEIKKYLGVKEVKTYW